MTKPSLHDCYVRLDGARKDLEALHREVVTFLGEHVYSVLREDDPKTAEHLLGIRIARPPADWGRRVGHIVNDLRTALEYLVYQLAWLDSGAIQSGTQFPICDTPDAFTAELKKGRLKGLSPTHVEAIESSQPYEYGGLWLRQVRELSNIDKHRYLHSATSDNWPPVPTIGGAIELRREHKPHRLMNEPGAQLPLTAKLDVQMDISTGVALSDGSPVVETLQVLEAGVRALVDALQPEF